MDPTSATPTAPPRQHWRDVVADLGGRADPTCAELTELATAHWWLCEIPAAIDAETRLHEQHRAEDRPAEAARRALRIALLWGTRGDPSLAKAWLERARRLLRDLPETAVHGYAVYAAAAFDLDLEGEPTGAARAGAELRAMASRRGDPALECLALTLTGMAEVRSGDLSGFAALDEAMIGVLHGRVEPFWGGDVFCSVIHLCEGLGDLARMRAWTDALASWASPLSTTFLYAGVTRVHQLELLRAEGAWDVVEQELGRRSADLADAHGWLAGAGFRELGEVHRLRGRDQEALRAFEQARSLGVDPQPGEALMLHARGETTRALDALRVALAGAGPIARARLIPAAVEVAVAAGEDTLARQLATEAERTGDRFGTPGLRANAARARATCLTAPDHGDEAIDLLTEAARIHRQQRQRYELARVHEALGTVHRRAGRTDAATADEATARAVYAALGATTDLARLDGAAAHPGGLTNREIDVLVRVAAGRTNKQVAADLVISDKTVGRHLSNIFDKTGVRSRTGAAGWAREHHLL